MRQTDNKEKVIKKMFLGHADHDFEVTENHKQDVYEVTCSCGDSLNIKRTVVSAFFELNIDYFLNESIYEEKG